MKNKEAIFFIFCNRALPYSGYFIWPEIGAVIGIIMGIILNMTFCSFRGVKVWKLCERDYYHLVSKGYSSKMPY